MKKILIVVGTRPNFIKVTQFKKEALAFSNLDLKIVHTGQHFDAKMADVFFEQFCLTPDFFLNIASNTSANSQMAEIMLSLEQLIKNKFNPDLMVVVGDVNSTFAAALTANKLGIKIAHLESGLRSFDRSMPEEHNRILTDKLTDYFFVTEKSGMENLKLEGVISHQIFFVGNTMIDTLVAFEDAIENSNILEEKQLTANDYVLLTMHRPATVDNREGLLKLLTIIEFITATNKVIFPIHPRTLKNMEHLGLKDSFEGNSNLIFTDPLDYFGFQKLVKYARYIITDSGGIQEETTFLKKPCLTLRPNTERPVTIEVGTNVLMPFDIDVIKENINAINSGHHKKGNTPERWDGQSTKRIVEIMSNL